MQSALNGLEPAHFIGSSTPFMSKGPAHFTMFQFFTVAIFNLLPLLPLRGQVAGNANAIA
jgi:hypothetical protein